MASRERKPRSNTAALVEGAEAPSERLSLEETWPAEQAADIEATGTPIDEAYDPDVIPPQSTAHPDNQRPYYNASSVELLEKQTDMKIGLSNAGPFIAPADAAPESKPPSTRKPKETVASMPRELAFSKFRDALFTLCFKFGFSLESDAEGHTHSVRAVDVSDAKGSAKRALAVSSMADLELRK